MSDLPPCPKCQSTFVYADASLLICPECAHEWSEQASQAQEEAPSIKDANGNILADGDSVSVLKDLKVKGSSDTVKVGTKVKGIKLVLGSTDGHNLDCKVKGIGSIMLKSEFVKKITS